MASLRKKGRNWYYRIVDADGAKIERKGCPDRRATEQLAAAAEALAAKIKAGLIDPRENAIRRDGARPIGEHLDDWRAALIARRRTETHARLYHVRASQVVAKAKAGRLTDLQPSTIQSALSALKDSGLSLETVNHHRAALRAFVRWARADGRLRDDPMAGVTGYNAKEDVRHPRRDLTDEELAQVIRAAENGPVAFQMPGPMRAMAYRLVAGTGFRANEIRTLTPECFRLDGPRPSIALRAKNEKNRKGTEQPISAALARDLRRWLGAATPGVPVLPLHHETAKAMRLDLEAAGIAYQTDEGIADFHSLRGLFISALIRSGASIKTVQTLARHSNPSLTLGRYARTSILDISGAVDSLPDLSQPAPRTEPAAMTGTDGPSLDDNLAHYLPTGGGGAGQNLTDAGGMSLEGIQDGAGSETSQILAMRGVGRILTASGVQETERGGFEPPKGFDTLNGLANRRFRPLSHLSRRATGHADGRRAWSSCGEI